MSKLQEASINYLGLDIEAPEAFIKGALWLLEQAYSESYPASEYSTSSVVDIKDLEELCQSEKK